MIAFLLSGMISNLMLPKLLAKSAGVALLIISEAQQHASFFTSLNEAFGPMLSPRIMAEFRSILAPNVVKRANESLAETLVSNGALITELIGKLPLPLKLAIFH